MSMKVEIDGFSAIKQKLTLLQEAVRDDGTRRAVKAASVVIKNAEVMLAPVLDEKTAQSTALDPGVLKAALGFKIRKTRQGEMIAWIGPKAGTGRVAHLVEYGHQLVRGGKLTRKGRLGAGAVVGHVPAHPFLRPALDASGKVALEAFVEAMKLVWKEALR